MADCCQWFWNTCECVRFHMLWVVELSYPCGGKKGHCVWSSWLDPGGGGGYTLIWAMWRRSAGQGMVFGLAVLNRVYNFTFPCPKQVENLS